MTDDKKHKIETLKIERISTPQYLGFKVSIYHDKALMDSMDFEYKFFQELMRLGPNFLSTCVATECIQRWGVQ